MEAPVTRNDEKSRYEIHVDGELAGFAEFTVGEFTVGEGTVVFTHTETLEGFQGRGIGVELAKGAIADAVERGDTIVPACAFIRRYLERNEVPGAKVHLPGQP